MTTATFDDVDEALIRELQQRFPIDHRPFERLGRKVEISEQECLKRIERLREEQVIEEIFGEFDAAALGYHQTLIALRVPNERLSEAAKAVIAYPGVFYAGGRNDPLNLWVALGTPVGEPVDHVVNVLHAVSKAEETTLLGTEKIYSSGRTRERPAAHKPWEGLGMEKASVQETGTPLEKMDRVFINALQEDLPLLEMPYTVPAEQAGASEEDLFNWMAAAQREGWMQRMSASVKPREVQVLTSMTVVWQVPDGRVDAVGAEMARFREVSRCERHRTGPDWPYSLFSVILGRSSDDCMDAVSRIEERVGRFTHKHLYVTKEFKHSRLRFFSPELEQWWEKIGTPTLERIKRKGDR